MKKLVLVDDYVSLGHDGLYKTTRKQYGKCKTGT